MSLYAETATVRHLEAWCRDHLGHHDSPEYTRYHARFQEHLTRKREEQAREHSNGGLFGMSGAAGCLRANALKRARAEGKPMEGDTLVTFEIGHLLECMTLAVLDASGFKVEDPQRPVELGGVFRSAVDGIVTAGPVALPYPVVLSVKTASYKSSSPPRGNAPAKRYGFAALPLDGVRKAQPSWWVQSQLEMAATGFERSLVVAIAKDMIAAFRGDSVFTASGSLSWYAELIPAEPMSAGYLDRRYRDAKALLDDGGLWPQQIPPVVYQPDRGFVVLPAPGDVSKGWGGPNKEATGTFSPCFGCQYGGMPEVCS